MRPANGRRAPIRFGAFPVDPVFPQLEVAGDSVRMLEMFRAHLSHAPGRNAVIQNCRPTWFRCFQSTSRCVLQYALRVTDPDTGREWSQWVTGLLYAEPGAAEATWQKMRLRDPLATIPEHWRSFEPAGYIPELEMAIEVFPYDRRLPQLGPLLNGGSSGAEYLLTGPAPGSWQAAGPPELEPARYRAELGAVLRWSLPVHESASGRGARRSCYLKVGRDARGSVTFEALRSWSQRGPRERPGYSLVGALAYWSELRTLVLDEAPGTSLKQLLLHGDDPVQAARSAARALAAFHQDDLHVARTVSAADLAEDLHGAAALVQWACREKRAKIAGVAAVVARNLEDGPATPVHGGLKPDRVFLRNGRVAFLAADTLALGDPVRDCAHLFAHLVGRMGLEALPPGQALAVASAFAEEYFNFVPEPWQKRFRLHCAAAFIEAAAALFRSQVPGWRERVSELSSHSRHALAGDFG